MKLMVLTCAVFPSEEEARKKLWIFRESCKKYVSIEDAYYYGIGKTFPGYRAMKLDMQLEWLENEASKYEYTHVLYTDSWDAFFCAPLSEIIEKYEAMGSPPILSSAFYRLVNGADETRDYQSCFDRSLYYRYPHVGGYIAEIPAIVEAFQKMLKLERQTGDDCHSWFDGWKEGFFRPALDSNCEIFQVTSDNVSIRNGRLRNIRTGSNPCILHLCGGYTDQKTGKDVIMEPWAKRLSILANDELPSQWEAEFEKAFEYTKDVSGSFQWLSCRELFKAAIRCKGLMVEVGVDQGRSASILLAAARITGASVVLVDSWESELADNMLKVEKICAGFAIPISVMRETSSEAAMRIDGPIDLVHIDANHYDDNPDKDCEAWLPKIKSGGFACFHDFESCFPAVTEAVNKHTSGWEDLGSWEGLAVRRKP